MCAGPQGGFGILQPLHPYLHSHALERASCQDCVRRDEDRNEANSTADSDLRFQYYHSDEYYQPDQDFDNCQHNYHHDNLRHRTRFHCHGTFFGQARLLPEARLPCWLQER